MTLLQWSVVFLILVFMAAVVLAPCVLSSRISGMERKSDHKHDFDDAWQQYAEGELDK